MRRLALAALIAGCGGTPAPSVDASVVDSFLGPDMAFDASPCTPRASFDATGFFAVAEDCGRWWLVDPTGQRFYSFGVNHVQWEGDYAPTTNSNPYADAVKAKYGTSDKWADATAARMRQWGWNTVGAWSSDFGARMPYTLMLSLAQADWRNGAVPDYFSDAWAAGVKAGADAGTKGRTDDPNLVGYFIDNELRWGLDWRGGPLFDDYLKLDAGAAGKRALVGILKQRHATVDDFNAAWGTKLASLDDLATLTALPTQGLSVAAQDDRSAFLTALARRFFQVTTGAIRADDPHHLVLGVRFIASLLPIEVAQASGEFLDVVSANAYEFSADPQSIFDPTRNHNVDLSTGGWLEAIYRVVKRPILVSEFGFRAADSGLPNTWPPFYPTLATQAERADRFEAYARRCQAAPWIVGYHWFEYTDEPAAGRFDGENDNWGLVNVADDPYATLVARTAAVNVPPAP